MTTFIELMKKEAPTQRAEAANQTNPKSTVNNINTPSSDAPSLKFSVFSSVTATKSCEVHIGTWPELVEHVKKPKLYPTKAAQPLIKLATFGDKPNAKGSIRHDPNVDQVYGLEADYDAGLVSPEQAAALLKQAFIRALLYTSASHTAENPRWRVLVPFQWPVAPAERAKYMSMLNGVLGGILAPESWTLSQLYYFGAVEGVEYQAIEVEGECIDLVAYVDGLAELPPAARLKAAIEPLKARSAADINDLVLDYLYEKGMVKSIGADGVVHVVCPWEHEHGTGAGADSSTSYIPAGVGGRDTPGFSCLHGTCKGNGRHVGQFLHAVGYELSLFEVVPTDGDEPELLPAVERNPKGKILATRNNLVAILEGAGHWAGARLGYDSFRERVMIAPAASVKWRPLLDEDYTALSKRLESGSNGFVHISADLTREVVRYVAHEQAFDSARQWLEGLEWDGVPRVDAFLSNHFGVAATPYTRAVARYLWSALAGRCLQPGIKADMVPVLAGPQGAGKSSIVAALAPTPEAFLELDLGQSEYDQARQMCGKLVVEFGELRGLRAREQEALKAFIVRRIDSWIPKYQECERQYPRRSVFIGTTNSTEFLVDETGHRRWLPVETPARSQEEVSAAVVAVVRDRDQLWAEGAVLFAEGGVQWAEAEALARAEVGKFEAIDAWTGAVHAWLNEEDFPEGDEAPGRRGDRPFTSSSVLAGAIRLPLDRVTDAHRKRITSVLRGLGYTSERRQVDGARNIYFFRTGGAL